jgi:3-oxoacyl-[acyl-carrier protein] reductase
MSALSSPLPTESATDLLSGRVAVVTGAAHGIGLAIARTLSRHGAAVVVADIDAEAAAKAATEISAAGGQASAIGTDVADEEQVQAAVDHAVRTHGGLHVYVNNAEVTRDASMQKMTLDRFRTVVDIHLQGAWLGTRAAAAAMRESGGSIINISPRPVRPGCSVGPTTAPRRPGWSD